MELNEIRLSLYELEQERNKILLAKREIEAKLIKYKRRVQMAGRLPQNEYNTICRKQDELRQEHIKLEQLGVQLNMKIKQKELLLDGNINNEPNDIKSKIIKIKNKYMDFASDNTRVNSMRLMASQFVTELENALNQ